MSHAVYKHHGSSLKEVQRRPDDKIRYCLKLGGLDIVEYIAALSLV